MLVIFDCDGVLVDSEHLASEVFSEQLSKAGIDKTPEQCFSTFKGHTLDTCLNMLQSECGPVIPVSFLDDLKVATQIAFKEQLKPIDGIESVLQELTQQKIPFCVASNGGYEKVRNSLTVTGLSQYFPETACFSADSVKSGKPAPDLFLLAAQKMGHDVTEVIIIEDSETGVKAGVAAGMRVKYFTLETELSGPYFTEPSNKQVTFFSRMSKLMSLLYSF